MTSLAGGVCATDVVLMLWASAVAVIAAVDRDPLLLLLPFCSSLTAAAGESAAAGAALLVFETGVEVDAGGMVGGRRYICLFLCVVSVFVRRN